MVLNTSFGKIILTPYEIVIRIQGEQHVTLQAQADAIELIGQGANVVMVNGSESKWSLKLDNPEQLTVISEQLGCDIR
ncbi:DUF3389 domain-containing protein [Vibrio maerlii]|uniref:DUF3389 domain-containing protein n=1 Tax=Vibrio maerlii TaxID=2231648 RepID=UPI000E3E68D5|nr:DUF3389 domain-containing protein [Vibrio maerlii]